MRIRRWLGTLLIRLLGWRLEGEPPPLPKYVLVGAPHTSNWDGLLMLAFAWRLGLQLQWVGKHTLVKPPLGWLLVPLGAIGVDRRAPKGFVQQMADEFARRDELRLVLAPEGTRGRAPGWKSGFYRIALAARVPIVLAYLDYSRKVAGFASVLEPSGELQRDLEVIRKVYVGVKGRYPENASPIEIETRPPAE